MLTRKFILVSITWLLVLTSLKAATPWSVDFVKIAGNAESDSATLAQIERLANESKLRNEPIEGLTDFLDFLRKWNSPEVRLNFFTTEIRKSPRYDVGVPESSPLYPLAAYYRARMLIWAALEFGDIMPVPERREIYLGEARSLLRKAEEAFPQNRIIKMYLGTPFPAEKSYKDVPEAPAWAAAQRVWLERLTDVIHWWVDHRLQASGEYGGGWGDDCEMWRQWTPVLLGFTDPKANLAQAYLSKRLLAQPYLAEGYSSRMTDVEHSSEDLSDALSPMMLLAPNEPEWEERVKRLMELATTRWMGKNEKGFLQFKSTYFTATEVDLKPNKACDTVYHARALQPAMLYWMRTHDQKIGAVMRAWMDTWVDAAASTDRGKPAGILPTAIHWPDGSVGGVGPNWWQPKNYHTALYDFPSVMPYMLNTLLLTYHMSGDQKYLMPLRTMAQARLAWLKAGKPEGIPGSIEWCAARMGGLAETIAKYRMLSNDRSFDELLRLEESQPYVTARIDNQWGALTRKLEDVAQAISVNLPAFTTEVRYTDRLFRYAVLHDTGWLYGQEPSNSPKVGELIDKPVLLYNTVTGDPGSPLYFPINAVRWLTEPRQIATLVEEASSNSLQAKLYHFGNEHREMGCELLLLKPGEYVYALSTGQSGKFTVVKAAQKISFSLPPTSECQLSVRRAQ